MNPPSASRREGRRSPPRISLWRLLALSVLLLGGCASLPPLQGRPASQALAPEQAAQTRLGQALAPALAAHPGFSGIHTLSDAHEAFAARVHMIHAATRTLDVQYYIWRDDITGTLLFQALRAAADRGVRVRLLLDDNNTKGLDAVLAELDAHPNIQLRLFNPFVIRGARLWGFITDFSRVNRRMHNKSLTADNRVTLIGGRNIGDEYFGATPGLLFADLDVLAVGPVVQAVSDDFDRYWRSASAYPAQSILNEPPPGSRRAMDAALALVYNKPDATTYLKLARQGGLAARLSGDRLSMEWAPTHLVSDDPAKALRELPESQRVMARLQTLLGTPQRSLDIVSPYFVPTRQGVDRLSGLVADGVRVRVLTNALEATDVAAVHAGYARWRKALLRAGVELFEMKGGESAPPGRRRAGPWGSASLSLHAKTLAVDGRRLAVGSFNMDPRSAHLNTEIGFVIDSPALAGALHQAFSERVPDSAYQVRLDKHGDLYWVGRTDQGPVLYYHDPGSGLLKRMGVSIMTLLPIEWML
ncbi:phospholipase D family protein [Alloalcanivorax mobilis]|uniref:phospholipase D family protein n=1 Tax=Alloalcanivorax mobilis TaxID=2019569 RepID=UPI000C792AF8|nr:phospholipase D family protein [Alloalcanivorax mobilis]